MRPRTAVLTALAAIVAVCAACTGGDGADDAALTIWFHDGKPGEVAVLQQQVAAFQAAHPEIPLRLVLIPEQDYHLRVESAAAAGKLPDILDFDGPFLAHYAWKGYLRPLDGLLGAGIADDLLPSIRAQGLYAGRFYGVGTFDSGLGLYADRAQLEAAGARIPSGVDDAWAVAEFGEVLEKLAAREGDEGDGQVLDLKLNYSGEWATYAFSPALQSAGADLVTRAQPPQAAGTLDGDAAVAALGAIQGWREAGRVDPNSDDAAFVQRRVALSWSGHWDYPRYRAALGDDLLVLPLPDFGQGPRTGQGSWAWGITTACSRPEDAARFLAFLLGTEQVLAMANANGAVPATRAAVAASPLYGEDGPLALFATQLGTIAVPRPVTPAYPVITRSFQDAYAAVLRGDDVRAALGAAAGRIDADVESNKGYPPPP